MIDVHSHIVPNVDDGSKNLDDTFNMIEEASKVGFTDIIATPHYIVDSFENDSNKINFWIEKIQEVINNNDESINIHTGMEIYISEKIIDLLSTNKLLKLANSNYILIEFPLFSTIRCFDNLIFLLTSIGLKPIIAHPERYKSVQENFNIIEEYIKNGCLIQCNYGSILGLYGKKAKKILKILLKKNLVHFLGSDSHNSKGIYILIPKAIKKIQKITGKKGLYKLTTENPKKILDNEKW